MSAIANLVRVLSLTTGTGTLTLSTAIQGFLTPSQAGMIDGLVYSYAIEADYIPIGDDMVPTSREVGVGTYTASGPTLSRTVISSTNSNALLNLTGDAQVFITPIASSYRELIAANRTVFVRKTGNDSNDGSSAAAAFLTINAAYTSIVNKFDVAGFNITVDIGAGSFVGAQALNMTAPWLGGGTIIFSGAGSASTTLDSDGSFPGAQLGASSPGKIRFQNMQMNDTGGWGCINVAGALLVDTGADVKFGAGTYWISVGAPGAVFDCVNYGGTQFSVNGAASSYGLYAFVAGSRIRVNGFTVTGALAMGVFANGSNGGNIRSTGAYTSAGVTGQRFLAANAGIVDANGGGATYFPGSTAGSGTNSSASPYGFYL